MEYKTQKFSDYQVENPLSILSGSNIYKIPFSQRNFAWSTDDGDKNSNQIGKFWNAMLKQWEKHEEVESERKKYQKYIQSGKDEHGKELTAESISSYEKTLDTLNSNYNAEYFIGPMVFIKKSDEKFDVVDGQQRLSTITMILAICRDLYFQFNEQKFIDEGKIIPSKMFITLFNLLEISSDDNDYISKGKWKFQPNTNDVDIYNEIILPWDVNHHKEQNFDKPRSFREDNSKALCLRLEEKIRYCNNILQDKERKNKLIDSNRKLFQAYTDLYNKILIGLITNFSVDPEEQEKIMTEIAQQAEKNTITELHVNPENFKLNREFFDNDSGDNIDKFGIDFLLKQHWNKEKNEFEDINWTPDVEKKIHDKFVSSTKNPSHVTDQKFQQWLKELVHKKKKRSLTYLQTGLTAKKTYADIFDEYKEKKKNEIEMSMARKNLEQNRLDEFLNNMILKLTFSVRVTLKDAKVANLVFKTLNSYGEPLATSDLIKNHILDHIKADDEKKDYALLWDKIISNVSNKPDDFLELSLKSRGVKYGEEWEFNKFKVNDMKKKVSVSDDTLFDILEAKIVNENDAKRYVKDLEEDIEIYLKLKDPSTIPKESQEKYDRFEEIGPALDILETLGYVYAKAPIMMAWRHWGNLEGSTWENNDRSFVVLIKLLVIWLFRFKTIRTISGAASTIESVMTKITRYIKNNPGNTSVERQKVLENISKFLIQYDDNEDFIDALKKTGLVSSTAHLDVTILSQINRKLSSNPREVLQFSKFEREHVLPQDFKEWQKPGSDFFSDWVEVPDKNSTDPNHKRMLEIVEFFDSEALPKQEHDYEDMVYKLGNMTLLIKKMNGTLGKLKFNEKKFHYDSKSTDFDLKNNQCELAGDSTSSPPKPPCQFYNKERKSKVPYNDPKGFVVPKDTITLCPKHDIADGYNSSKLPINIETVMNDQNTGNPRDKWTALTILERTKYFIELTSVLWQLPKIYCSNSNCPNFKKEVRINKVELDNIDNKFVGNKKCDLCQWDLEVLWAKSGTAPDLDVPSQYRIANNRLN